MMTWKEKRAIRGLIKDKKARQLLASNMGMRNFYAAQVKSLETHLRKG